MKTDKTVVGSTKGQTHKRAIFIIECAPTADKITEIVIH